MPIKPEQAKVELAKRELERREQKNQPARQVPPVIYGGLPALSEILSGGADFLNTAARGAVGSLAGGINAAVGFPDRSVEAYNRTVEKPIFNRPLTTPVGQSIAEGLSPVAEDVDTFLTDVGGIAPGGPVAQSALKTAVLGPLELFGLGRAGSGIAKAATKASPPGTFIPSIKDLYGAGRVAFNEARINGGGVNPSALGRLRNAVSDFRNEAGVRIDFDSDLHPQAVRVRDRIINAVDNNAVDFDELLTLRELAGDVAGNVDKSIAMRGVLLKNEIDNFVDSLKVSDVVSGDPARAAQSLETARNLWRDASKARTIETQIELAGNRAGQFSGSGYENALRTQFRQLNARIIKGQEKGWTPAERAAIERVANGGKLDNLWRYIGKLAPTGVVSGGIGAGLGYTAFGPLGAAAVPATGALGRLFASRGTIANAQNALEMPLKRSVFNPDGS